MESFNKYLKDDCLLRLQQIDDTVFLFKSQIIDKDFYKSIVTMYKVMRRGYLRNDSSLNSACTMYRVIYKSVACQNVDVKRWLIDITDVEMIATCDVVKFASENNRTLLKYLH
jgi:hypothetical protein